MEPTHIGCYWVLKNPYFLISNRQRAQSERVIEFADPQAGTLRHSRLGNLRLCNNPARLAPKLQLPLHPFLPWLN